MSAQFGQQQRALPLRFLKFLRQRRSHARNPVLKSTRKPSAERFQQIMRRVFPICAFVLASAVFAAGARVDGRVVDPQGRIIPRAAIRLLQSGATTASAESNADGEFRVEAPAGGSYRLTVTAPGFDAHVGQVTLGAGAVAITLTTESRRETIAVGERTVEPGADEQKVAPLFSRDDQLIQQLNAGIDAGQHEGGGKSPEIRRFGFNLDHGGVNGGLKVVVDNIQQNQGTQAHGQGYLGALKALSPELIQDITVIDGPFRAEYGDFSGLGVVQIRQRESLPGRLHAAP